MSDEATRNPQLGIVPAPEDTERVRALIDRRGSIDGAKDLGVSRETMTRIAAGLGVRRGSLIIVRMALDAIDDRRHGGPPATIYMTPDGASHVVEGPKR